MNENCVIVEPAQDGSDGMYSKMPASAPDMPNAPIMVVVSSEVDDNGFQVGGWKSGIMSCFDVCFPSTCMAMFCPCISLAGTASRFNIMGGFGPVLALFGFFYLGEIITSIVYSASYQLHAADYYFSTSYRITYASYYTYDKTSLVLCFVFQVLAICALMYFRIRFRALFRIPGSAFEDCCCSFWCSCCTIVQMATHAETYKNGSCECGPKDTLPGYNV